jgi:uncharacterized protein
MTEYLDHPYGFGGRGRTATTPSDEHVRDLIRQVLFTAPGERVNRPDFGCGLRELVFAPSGEVLAAATQFLVRASLIRWLEGVIEVDHVEVEAFDSTLTVIVGYRDRLTDERRFERFLAPGTVEAPA